MLRINLSTKPFYNQRAIQSALAAVALVAIALTVFNVTQIVLLSRRQSTLSSRAAADESQARQLRAHAASVRQSIDPKQLEVISGAAHEANQLIGQRLFSWTDLLNRLETTLPEEVRITAMRPRIEKDGSITVVMTVVGRRVEDVDRFMANLEGNGAFADVYSREETTTEDGLRLVTIEGRYNLQMIPIQRAFEENRRLVIPVAAGLALNVILFAGVVYPLGARVRSAEQRQQAAARELVSAQREEQATLALLQGKDRADSALKTFYRDVLPNSLASANRLTYLRLAQLADQFHLRYSHRSAEPEANPQGPLRRLRISTVLEGDYENVRRFIYQLESGPDFIVIDSVTLGQNSDAAALLQLTISLSTFYRPDHGA